MIDIDELQKLTDGATPAPWINKPPAIVQKSGGEGPIIFWDDDGTKGTDYAFIAAARNAMPDLLRELRAAREVVEAAKVTAAMYRRLPDDAENLCVGELEIVIVAYDAVRGEET